MNSKGIVRIIEASISIILLIGVIAFLFVQTRPDFSGQDYDEFARDILEELASQSNLRDAVLSRDEASVNTFLESRIPSGAFNYNFTICNVNDVCGLSVYVPGEVYAQERVISSDINYVDYTPRKIRLFLWRNEA